MAFEEQYEDVLQNIEFAVINVYRAQPDLIDFDVEEALDALIARYRAEQQDRTPRTFRLGERSERVYEAAREMCEWRLGRITPTDQDMPTPDPLSLEEIVACLKRIKKSVQRWSRQGGRQAYLSFASQFIR